MCKRVIHDVFEEVVGSIRCRLPLVLVRCISKGSQSKSDVVDTPLNKHDPAVTFTRHAMFFTPFDRGRKVH